MKTRIVLLLLTVLEILAVCELQRNKARSGRMPDQRMRRLLLLNRLSVVTGAALITSLLIMTAGR